MKTVIRSDSYFLSDQSTILSCLPRRSQPHHFLRLACPRYQCNNEKMAGEVSVQQGDTHLVEAIIDQFVHLKTAYLRL